MHESDTKEAVVKLPETEKGSLPRKPMSYPYDSRNEKLPVFGVIVNMTSKIKYSTKQLVAKFEAKLSAYKLPPKKPQTAKRLKKPGRKETPYFRRVGPHKGIVMFDNWEQANTFAATDDPEYYAFIPLSFVVVVGVAIVKAKFNLKDFKYVDSYEVLQWRTERLADRKVQVTLAIRGTELPSEIVIKGECIPITLLVRQPIYCSNCLQYGHRLVNCMRKPRCGVCSKTLPFERHTEKNCPVIANGDVLERCISCHQNHTIGFEGCNEHIQQCAHKKRLVKQHMDFVSVLENDIIPSIRSTSVNSSERFMRD
ncbi:uncharacterized protein LOC129778010 [Toxorhynchites rutilus septentrionalis]|uniref:uncharacterized protein LOC129778010 n=1 Tax=Toxorhynchites rutilus septentrionalis TaxID=329112 RepID=UPI00247997B2|nr:uncharacterized protein LOC129778010 [Toxorhynchites rutilus septentrionalis]